MASIDDFLDLFDWLSAAGVKKVPRPADRQGAARVYSQILQATPSEVLVMAATKWCQDPDNGRWMPPAADLGALCALIEAEHYGKQAQKRRGCARCGELLERDGDTVSITQHGTGYRTLIQKCYQVIHGDPDWDGEPYRVARRSVLCDCAMGAHIMHRQHSAEAPPHHPTWQATLTWREAHERFQRHDARLFITGTDWRENALDRNPRSPFYSRPSPEEDNTDPAQALAERRAVRRAMSGAPPSDRAVGYLQTVRLVVEQARAAQQAAQ